MLKTLVTTASLACVLFWSPFCRSQALPTATAAGRLQAGVGLTYAKPDFGQKSIDGGTGFIDFDFMRHIGVEATIHYVSVVTPTDIGENTFLVGPRFFYTHGRFNLYAKAIAGIGDFVIEEQADNQNTLHGNFFAYAAGGGLDIDVTRHLVVRAIDIETQKWPGYGNGLGPTVATIGVAYRFR